MPKTLLAFFPLFPILQLLSNFLLPSTSCHFRVSSFLLLIAASQNGRFIFKQLGSSLFLRIASKDGLEVFLIGIRNTWQDFGSFCVDDMDCAETSKQSKVEVEVTHKDTGVTPDRRNSNSSCSSDFSEDSAVSSIFQSDPPAPQPKPDALESLGAGKTVESSSPSSLSRIQSSSRGSTQIRSSGVLGNHDPNRIPVSIFSSRPSNPMEWSTASNESLFSIHVGNNSFSREHFNFLTKSGELIIKSGELMMNPNSSQNLHSLPPFVEPARVESKTEIRANVFAEPVTSTGPQTPAILSQSVADHRKEATTRQSASNDSMNSSHSFQFPLLASEGATPKTTSSVSTDSGTTSQQQPVTKLESTKQPSEHQSPSHETTSASPTTNSGSSWFSCFSWCRCR